MKDFYYILGLDVTCSASEIREAYRKLSKKFHPDLNGRDNYFENRFREIRQAYETLIDPAGRAAYDSLLKKDKASLTKPEPKKRTYAKTTKSIDIAFTIVLIMLTMIFGDYVIKNLTGSKPKAVKIAAAGVDEKENVPVIKHHKKRRIFKTEHSIADVTSAPAEYKAVAKPEIKPLAVIQPVVSPQIKPIAKPQVSQAVNVQTALPKVMPPVPVVEEPKVTNTVINDNILTGAYIKSNATGVVYMRAEDNYNANIVSRIPGNSRIAILEKGDSFYKIEYHNQMGYVPKWTVRTDY